MHAPRFSRFQSPLWVALCALLLQAGCVSFNPGPAVPSGTAWLQHGKWDTASSEFAHYEGKKRIGGVLQEAQEDLQLVGAALPTAEFSPPRSTRGQDSHPAIRMSRRFDLLQGEHTRRQLASFWIRRDTGHLIKASAASLDWDGIRHVDLTIASDKALVQMYSDAQNPAMTTHEIPLDRLVCSDVLPMYLRQMNPETGTTLLLAPSFLTENPAWQTEEVTIIKNTPATRKVWGRSVNTQKIMIKGADWTETFWFSSGGLRPMVAWESSRGEFLELKSYQ